MRRLCSNVGHRAARWALTLAAIAATAACGSAEGRADKELGGLVVAPAKEPAAIEVSELATSKRELLRAVQLPHRRVGELVGGHRAAITSTVQVREDGETVEDLTTTLELAFRDDGQYSAVLDNSADYGRRVYFLDGHLLLAPRYSAFHRRPPNDDSEAAAIRDQLMSELAAQLELVLHAAELSPGKAGEVAGRPTVSVELARAPSPSKPPAQPHAHRAWRQTIDVRELAGNLTFHADSGVLLAGTLSAELGFVREGRSFAMKVAVEHALRDVGVNPTIEAPPDEQVVTVADHHAEAAERERLLRGIARPARSSPTPANTEGTAP